MAAIKTLKSQVILVIKQADEGGAVILNSEDYGLKALHQFSDVTY